MERIGVIGSGTWGTAIAILLSHNGHEVTLWSAIPSEIEELEKTRRHPNLPEAEIPKEIRMTADLKEAMEDKDLLVMAVPSVFVRETAKKMKPFCKDSQRIAYIASCADRSLLGMHRQDTNPSRHMPSAVLLRHRQRPRYIYRTRKKHNNRRALP